MSTDQEQTFCLCCKQPIERGHGRLIARLDHAGVLQRVGEVCTRCGDLYLGESEEDEEDENSANRGTGPDRAAGATPG